MWTSCPLEWRFMFSILNTVSSLQVLSTTFIDAWQPALTWFSARMEQKWNQYFNSSGSLPISECHSKKTDAASTTPFTDKCNMCKHTTYLLTLFTASWLWLRKRLKSSIWTASRNSISRRHIHLQSRIRCSWIHRSHCIHVHRYDHISLNYCYGTL